MKKLFETEIVTHRMAAILKTDLYSKLERLEHWKPCWKLSLRCANANSISRRRKKQEKQIFRLRHLIFQVSVINILIDSSYYVFLDLIQVDSHSNDYM